VIRLESVCKQHGGRILFLDAAMAVFRGEKVGLVGPNGAGKSTIFNMVGGQLAPDGDSGELKDVQLIFYPTDGGVTKLGWKVELAMVNCRSSRRRRRSGRT